MTLFVVVNFSDSIESPFKVMIEKCGLAKQLRRVFDEYVLQFRFLFEISELVQRTLAFVKSPTQWIGQFHVLDRQRSKFACCSPQNRGLHLVFVSDSLIRSGIVQLYINKWIHINFCLSHKVHNLHLPDEVSIKIKVRTSSSKISTLSIGRFQNALLQFVSLL